MEGTEVARNYIRGIFDHSRLYNGKLHKDMMVV